VKVIKTISISSGELIKVNVLNNTTCELVIETVGEECDVTVEVDVFVKVEASKLSLTDEFMQYEPITKREKDFKRLLTDAILHGLKDFWRPKYDPSITKDDTKICYEAGKVPAVGRSYNWWTKVAKDFYPERNSRLATRTEYIAFLGVLIKKLVEKGWNVKTAWDAICNDSKRLGNYINSESSKAILETTGQREVCGFYDLANTFKLLAEDDTANYFLLACGCYKNFSDDYPLADFYVDYNHWDAIGNYSVGLVVID